MPVNPLTIIAEILGEPADQMRNPAHAGYRCPFISSQCTKRSHSGQRKDEPYPVCTVWHSKRMVCVCPKRFFEADFLKDVREQCWPSRTGPANPRIAHEVTMRGFGCVDFVIADIAGNGAIGDFVSVELQAVDLTGSVYPAYEAAINSVPSIRRPSYGVNWANVRKRYVEQLIKKGFFHHHWNSRIVSVIQTPLYNELRRSIQFDELDPKSRNSNIVFMMYDYADEDTPGGPRDRLRFSKAVGTSHNSLMMSALYRTPPSRDEFCDRIRVRLRD